MRRMSHLQLGGAPPETVLPEPAPEARHALDRAVARRSRAALSEVAARWPRYLDVWAALALAAEDDDPVAAYAFARTGYHRGLDALRGAGWRGSGYVRWVHEPNRGFLQCLDSLRRLCGAIGEADEERRCAVFLRQLDPAWDHRDEPGGPTATGR